MRSRSTHRGSSSVVLALAVALALPASAQAATSYADAVAEHFLECLEAEGGTVTDEERELLAAAAGELASLLDGADGVVHCAAGSEGESACVQALEQTDCEQLAAELGSTLGITINEVPTLEWAAKYAMAISAKVLECRALELGGAPSSEEVAALDGYRLQIAQTMSSLVIAGQCTAVESKLEPCTDSIHEASCEATLASLASTLGGSVSDEPMPSEEEVEAMLAQEVDEPSDAEFDAMIDEAAANMSSPFPLFEGACAQLLQCGYAAALADDS